MDPMMTTTTRVQNAAQRKPHIWFCGGIWRCVAGWSMATGMAFTPVGAYRKWHDEWRAGL